MVAQLCIVVAAQKRKRIAWVQEFKEYMDNMITPSQTDMKSYFYIFRKRMRLGLNLHIYAR